MCPKGKDLDKKLAKDDDMRWMPSFTTKQESPGFPTKKELFKKNKIVCSLFFHALDLFCQDVRQLLVAVSVKEVNQLRPTIRKHAMGHSRVAPHFRTCQNKI